MDNFCIIANKSKDKGYKMANHIKEFLESKGKSCMIATDYGKERDKMLDISEIPKETQCAIVLGGDGTIIQVANELAYEDISILGVNLGTLGFLADIEKQNIFTAIEQLLQGEYTIESRMMLDGVVFGQGRTEHYGFALNDFIVSKGGCYNLVTMKVYVNDELMDTYIGDGLIVSTPTGSTGYNLSAGGPVMAPHLEAVIITPICPHSLNNRSIVVSSEDKISIEIGNTKEVQEDKATLLLDGGIVNEMVTGDRVTISKAKMKTKIIKLNGISFFQIFRNKLGIGKR